MSAKAVDRAFAASILRAAIPDNLQRAVLMALEGEDEGGGAGLDKAELRKILRESAKISRIVGDKIKAACKRIQAGYFKGESSMERVRFGFLFVMGAALALSACGASEFENKVEVLCQKEGGAIPTVGRVDCKCAAKILDGALDSKSKALLLADAAGTGLSKEGRQQAYKDAGIDPEDARAMKELRDNALKQIKSVTEQITKECKAS